MHADADRSVDSGRVTYWISACLTAGTRTLAAQSLNARC